MDNHQIKNKHALENFRIFPIIAWLLTLGFAYFVYTITVDLKDITLDLKDQTDRLEAKVNATSSVAETDYSR